MVVVVRSLVAQLVVLVVADSAVEVEVVVAVSPLSGSAATVVVVRSLSSQLVVVLGIVVELLLEEVEEVMKGSTTVRMALLLLS